MQPLTLLTTAGAASLGAGAGMWLAASGGPVWLPPVVAAALAGTAHALSSLRTSRALREVEPLQPARSTFDAADAMRHLAVRIGELEFKLARRERLLKHLAHDAPMAILLLSDAGRVVYANRTAEELFLPTAESPGEEPAPKRGLEGQNFITLLERAHEPFREAFMESGDAVFTVDVGDERETFHLVKRPLEEHTTDKSALLLVVQRVTRELRRQEVEAWRKLLRILNHELNNSLGPISSLVRSARQLAKQPEHQDKLERAFDTIDERTKHLSEFLSGYAQITRVPRPKKVIVPLGDLFERIRTVMPQAMAEGDTTLVAWADASQLEQVLINLVKNAIEAAGAESDVSLRATAFGDGAVRISVTDRGPGMTREVMEHAFVPFFTTKDHGTGIGLALCREILDAHGGKMRIESRAEGLVVSLFLPGPGSADLPARLTLTRG